MKVWIHPPDRLGEVAGWIAFAFALSLFAWASWIDLAFRPNVVSERFAVLFWLTIIVAFLVILRVREQLHVLVDLVVKIVVLAGVPILTVILMLAALQNSRNWIKERFGLQDEQLIGAILLGIAIVIAFSTTFKAASNYPVVFWGATLAVAVGLASNWAFAVAVTAAGALLRHYFRQRIFNDSRLAELEADFREISVQLDEQIATSQKILAELERYEVALNDLEDRVITIEQQTG